jgi:3-oxoacyl-[acyl-carrier-protein] synthase-3
VDLNGACTGFLYALDTASCLIQAGRAKNVLIVCGEKMSAHVDWTDRRTCVLFGDGAAACVVSAGSMLRYMHLQTQPDLMAIHLNNAMGGNNPLARNRTERGFVSMDGQRVFKFAVSMIEQEVTRALAHLNLEAQDIDHYLIHQANRRILDFAVGRLNQPHEKFPMNIDRYGNISAVSIPLLMHEMIHAGTIQPGQMLLLCAFGAGLTAGSCVLRWE